MEYDDEGNIIDPITLDLIPDDRCILFEQNNVTFCFDIEFLSQYVHRAGYINPLNKLPFDTNIIYQLDQYIQERTRYIPIYVHKNICNYLMVCKWYSIDDIERKLSLTPRYQGCKMSISTGEHIERTSPIEDISVVIIVIEITASREPCIVV
jgi:hypothetical protein